MLGAHIWDLRWISCLKEFIKEFKKITLNIYRKENMKCHTGNFNMYY